MPRAHRHFLAGHVWHITHRCHERSFLLKFSHDRRRYLHWLFEAKKRFGLCVLDYMVTSNHTHLLVKDTRSEVIARSMQLMAGRTAQEYNERKARKGAFWEDRYHATAIETDEHLHRCVAYIDLNMVRAGRVRHPREWAYGGYNEIQRPPKRYTIIDLPCLAELCGFEQVPAFQQAHKQWIDAALNGNEIGRDTCWSEAVAVGTRMFVEGMKADLGPKAAHRDVTSSGVTHVLSEPASAYTGIFRGESDGLRPDNSVFW